MQIIEIYKSLQGESSYAGLPCVFVRLAGCNLRCTWCDSEYTFKGGQRMTLDEVEQDVLRLAPDGGLVEITGGEPMIAPQIVELTERMRALGHHITIETAGTVYHPVLCDLMSISPKLANSTPHERDGGRWAAQHDRLRIQPGTLSELMAGYEYQLKFVIEKPDDLEEVLELVGDLKADRGRVILMPEGTDREQLRERSLWLAEVCKDQGFRLSPRLHVDLYGNRRGV